MSSSQTGRTIEWNFHLASGKRGRQTLVLGDAPLAAPVPALSVGRVPRLARLMALAIRFESLVAHGDVKDYAELAHLGHVTRARVTQIMNLLNLAPDIQEAILFLPSAAAGRDPIKEWQVRPIAAEPNWAKQRRLWTELT